MSNSAGSNDTSASADAQQQQENSVTSAVASHNRTDPNYCASSPALSASGTAVTDGRRLLESFRREKRASSVDRVLISRGRGGQGRPRVPSGPNHTYDEDNGGGLHSNGSPATSLDSWFSSRNITGGVRGSGNSNGGRRSRFYGTSPFARPSLEGVGGVVRGAGGGRGHSLPRMRGPQRSAEDEETYEAQLAQLLSRWEAERAATMDLQSRAAAAVSLHDQVRASADELSRTRSELDSARSELEHERRRRDAAENELNNVRGELIEQRRNAEACAEENQALRSKVEALEVLDSQLQDTVSEADRLRANLQETTDRLILTQERLQKLEELRSRDAETSRLTLEVARKDLEEAQAENAERARERSARAAGLQELLREQGALLAEREERLAEERAGRAAERLELRECRSREAGRVRELKEKSEEIEELNQVLAQLQEGNTLTVEAMGNARALQAENEMLQARLDQASGSITLLSDEEVDMTTEERGQRKDHRPKRSLRVNTALRQLVRAAERKSGAGESDAARELSDTKERLSSVEAERLRLEQRLNAVEARVSEGVRNRADLSRRLAETAIAAEEAGVQNQRLRFRVRSLSETWAGDQQHQTVMDLSSSSSSEWKSNADQAEEVTAEDVLREREFPGASTSSELQRQIETLQAELVVPKARAAVAEDQVTASAQQMTASDAPQQKEAISASVVDDLRDRLQAAEGKLSAAKASERRLQDQLAAAKTTLPDEESGLPRCAGRRPSLQQGGYENNSSVVARRAKGSDTHDGPGEQPFVAATVDQAALVETLEAMRSQLTSSQADVLAVEEQWSSALADAQGQLAYEAERAATLEREVASLRSRTQQMTSHGEGSAERMLWTSESAGVASDPLTLGANQLQSQLWEAEEAMSTRTSTSDRQAEALVVAQNDLAAAKVEIEALTAAVRNTQDNLDAAERKVLEHAAEATAAREREQAQERATAEEVTRAQTALHQRLQDAETRAVTLGKELEFALRTKHACSQGARDDEAAEAFRRPGREESAVKELRELERRLDATHEELAAARAKVAQASQRSALSAAEVTKSHAEAAELRARVSAGEKQLAGAFEEAEGLRAEVRKLQYRLREIDTRAGDEATRLQEVSAENEALKSTVFRLEKQLESAETNCAAAREKEAQALEAQRTNGAKVEELIAAWTTARDGLAEATRRASKADQELAKVKQEADAAVDATRTTAAEDIAAARQRADEAITRAVEAEEQAKVAQAEAGDAAAKLSAARVKAEAAEADLAAVRAWAEAGSQRAGATLSTLQRRATALTERAERAETELRTLRVDLDARTDALAAARARWEQAEKAREATREETATSISDLRARLSAAETQADCSAKEAADEYNKLKCYSTVEINRLQEKVDEANSRAGEAEHGLSKAQEALEAAAVAESAAAIKAASTALQLGSDLASVKDELAQAKDALSTHRESAAAQIAAQAEALERLEETARRAEENTRLAAAERGRLEHALAEADTSAIEARGAAQVAEDGLRSLLEASETSLQLKSEALITAEQAASSAKAAVEAERAQTTRLTHELSEAHDQLAAADAQMAARSKAAAADLSKLQERLDEALAREQAAIAEVANLQETARTAKEANIAAAVKAASEESRLRSHVAERNTELARVRAALSAQRDSALTQGAAQTEAFERMEEAVRQAESAAQAAAAVEVRRLEGALIEAEASHLKAISAAKVTEEGLRARLEATERNLLARSEALAASEESRRTAEARLQAGLEAVARDRGQAAAVAEDERVKLQAVVDEAQTQQRRTAEELTRLREAVQAAKLAEGAAAASAASDVASLETELTDVKKELAQTKRVLSTDRARAAAHSVNQTEALERTEKTARNAEQLARTSMALEVQRLEHVLSETKASRVKAGDAAQATEDGLRSLLDSTELDLRIRSEALVTAKEAHGYAEVACEAARAEAARLATELSERVAKEATLEANLEAAARDHQRAAMAAAGELSRRESLLQEAESREAMLRDEINELRRVLQAAEEAKSTATTNAAVEAARLGSDLAEVKRELAQAEVAISAHRASAAAQGAAQAEAFECVEDAARQAEATARAAAASDVHRFELALSQAETDIAETRAASKATEEGLRAVLEATESDLFAQCEATSAAQEGRIAMEVARDEALAEVERVAAELNGRLDAVQAQAHINIQGAAERHARASLKATEDIADLQKRLDEAETRESVTLAELALSKEAAKTAGGNVMRLESVLAQTMSELAEAQARMSALRMNAASQGSAQAKALERVEEAARQAGERARVAAADEVHRLEVALSDAEALAEDIRERAEIAKAKLSSRLAAAEAATAVSTARADNLASELVVASADADRLRSRLASAEAASRENAEWSDAARASARQAEADLRRATSEATTSAENHRKEMQSMMKSLQGEIALLERQRTAAEQARAAAEDEAQRLGDTLRAELRAVDRRLVELTAERDDAEARLATATSAVSGELARNSHELEVSQDAMTIANEVVEVHGDAAAAAVAARALAERERDEAKAALLSALESSFVIEDELVAHREGGARLSMKVEGLTEGIRDAVEASVEAAAQVEDERQTLLLSIDEQIKHARAEGEAAGWAAAKAATLDGVGARDAELSSRLAEVHASKLDSTETSEAQSRLIEARQWEEAEASFARDMEAGKRGEEDPSATRKDAEFAREQAEERLEQAFVELQKSDAERAEIDGRLREAERELSVVRMLLREAEAEREILQSRLEEARREAEELIQAAAQHTIEDAPQPQSQGHLQGSAPREDNAPASPGGEAFIRERALREEAESRYAQMRAALDEQLELDAEALERMDELTIQAREEQAATERERARLEGCVGQLERGKQAAEGALLATQQELEEACLELEDVSHRLEQSQRQLSIIKDDLSETRDSLAITQGELADARSALLSAEKELVVVKEELRLARETLSVARDDLGVAREELEVARSDLASTQSTGGEFAGVRRKLTAAEGELTAVREELSATKLKLATANVDAPSVRKELENSGPPQGDANHGNDGRVAVAAECPSLAGDSIERQLETIGDQRQALQTAFARTEDRLRTVEAERASAERQLSSAQESLREAAGVREHLNSARAELIDARATFEETLRVADKEKREAEASVAHLQGLLDNSEANGEAMRDELDRANEKRAAAEAKAADLVDKLAQAHAEAAVFALEAERAEEREESLKDERGFRSHVERKLKAAVESQATLQERLSALEADLLAAGRLADERAEQAEALERQNRSLNRELEVREASAAASRAEAVRLEAERAEAEACSARVQEQLSEALHKLGVSTAELESVRRETRAAEEGLRESAAQVVAVKAECSAVSQSRDLLEARLAETHGKEDEITQRELHGESERCRLDHLLQETRAALETAKAVAAASSTAEREAAERAQQARAARETAEDFAAAAELRTENLESECEELREAVGRLGVQVGEASEREGVLRGLLDRAEDGRAKAEGEGEGARREVVCLKTELLAAKRKADDGESERARLAGQVTAITQEVVGANERERHARDELSALRAKASAAENQALHSAREAERQERSLRAEMQARDIRIAELEAQTTTLTAAHDRLARAREMIVADSVRSRDILHSATDRLRRLRRPSSDRRHYHRAGAGVADENDGNVDEFGRNPRKKSDNTHGGASRNHCAGADDGCAHGGVGVVLANSGGDAANDDVGAWVNPSTHDISNPPGGDNVFPASAGSLPSRLLFLNSSMDSSINNAAAIASRFAAEYHGEPVSVFTSMPDWRGSSVGVENAREAGSPVQRTLMREGAEEWEGEDGGDGVAIAAMEMLREVERMKAAMWELEQNERTLLARLADEADALVASEEAGRHAEERARAAAGEAERLTVKVESLEADNRTTGQLLADAEVAASELQRRLERSEPLEDLKAKVRAGNDEIRRLRGQLKATGLSDTTMMALLKGKDAALAAAAARASGLETAKRELQEQCEIAEEQRQEAEEVAEIARGQLEGRGTFDRRLKTRLERAEEELEHLRVQAAEVDAAATTLRARLDASTAEAETIATELHESKEAVAARDDLLREAREAAESSKERLVRVLGEGEAAARRAGEAEALAAAEAATVARLREDLVAGTAKLDAVLQELQERETQLLEKSQAEAILRAEGEEMRVRVNELEGSLREMADLFHNADSAKESHECLLQEKETCIEALRREGEELRDQIVMSERSRSEAEEVATAAAEAAAAEMAARIQQGLLYIDTLKAELQQKAADSLQAEEEAKTLTARISMLETEVEAKTLETEDLQVNLTETRTNAADLGREVADLRRRARSLEGEKATQQAQLAALETRAGQERAKADALQISLDAANKETSFTRESLAEAKAGLAMAKEALDQAQTSLEAERAGVATAREDLATARERLRRSQEEDLATAMSDLAASREETATVAAERDSLDARLQEELDARRAANERTAAAQREAADARNAAAGLREAVSVGQAKAAADIEEAISVAEAAAAETRAVVQELEAAQRELGNAREQLAEASAGRLAMTEAVEIVREESVALKEQWRAADDEARVYRELSERLSADEQALRQNLSTSRQAFDSLQAELSVLKSTIDARTAALASAETARDSVNAAATAAAEAAAAREEDLTSELAALRAMTGDARHELEGEAASLREQLREATERTKQLHREGEAAATAAEITAEQRAIDSAAVVDALKLELSAAEERANEAVAAAQAAAATAAAKSSSSCDAIRKAEAAAEAAEEQAAAAFEQARAEEARSQALALELEAARAQAKSLADMNVEHAEASARLEAEQAVHVQMRLLGQKLDTLLGNLQDNIVSVPGDGMVDNSSVAHHTPVPDGEVGGDGASQEDAAARVAEAERLIAVVKEAAVLTDGLREALVSAGEEADETAMELDAALAEVYCLRSHNATLEETIAKVTNVMSRHGNQKNRSAEDLPKDHRPHSSTEDEKLDPPARAEALERTNQHLIDLLESLPISDSHGDVGVSVDDIGRSFPPPTITGRLSGGSIASWGGVNERSGTDARSRRAMRDSDFNASPRVKRRYGGCDGLSNRGRFGLPQEAAEFSGPSTPGCGGEVAEAVLLEDNNIDGDDDRVSEPLERGRQRCRRRRDDTDRSAKTDRYEPTQLPPKSSPSAIRTGVEQSSGLSRALRSLANAVQERDTCIVGLEADLRRVRDEQARELQARESALEAATAEMAALRAELESVQRASAASNKQNSDLEGRVAELSRKAKADSLEAKATVESLEKELAEAREEGRALAQERQGYGAEIQESLAEGQESILVLQEALEDTLDSARGVLERAEAMASEAEAGEVETLQAELRVLERRSPTVLGRNSHRYSVDVRRPRQGSASPPVSPGRHRNQTRRGRARIIPNHAPIGVYGSRLSYNPRNSWPLPIARVEMGRARSGPIVWSGDGEAAFPDAMGLVGAEATVRQAGSEMQEVCFAMETFVLKQAIARAADVRRNLIEADSHGKIDVERTAGNEEFRPSQQRFWNEADQLVTEEKLTRVEADLACARHEVEERSAEVDALKTQRGSLMRRVAAAEAETALSHAIGTVASNNNDNAESSALMNPHSSGESRTMAVTGATTATAAAGEAAEIELASARADLAAARSELLSAREQVDALRMRLSEEGEERRRLEGEEHWLHQEREILDEDRTICETERRGLKEARARLEDDKSRFDQEREELVELKKQQHQHPGQYLSHSRENDSLKAAVKANAEAMAQMRVEIAGLRTEVAAAEGRATHQALSAENTIAELKERTAELTERLEAIKEELAGEQRALEGAKRLVKRVEGRAERAEQRRRSLEEEVEAAGRRARTREENIRDLESRLQAESRRRQSMEHALQDAEATRRFKISGVSSVKDGAETSGASSVTIVELRGEVSKARARAEILEERLDETVKCNRRLEREVAQAVELGARAEAELSAALAGERMQRDGELTEIKSVVDEMMTLDASASGGGIAGRGGDLFSPPRGKRAGWRNHLCPYPAIASDVQANTTMNIVEVGATTSGSASILSAGAAARLTEAWSLLEASEAARRQLQAEVKGWAERAARLEGALAAAEAAVEEGAREARLLAASLQDAREGLAAGERARREAEGRADALRAMLQGGDGGGSGGGVSPAGGGSSGGDIARGLEGQVNALRSRVEELLQRAREAEVREVLEKRGRKAAQRALSELANREPQHRPGSAPAVSNSFGATNAKRKPTLRQGYDLNVATPVTRQSPDRSSVAGDAVMDGLDVLSDDDQSRRARGQGGVELRAGEGGGGMQGGEEGGDDAIWLKEAEALLACSSHDLGY